MSIFDFNQDGEVSSSEQAFALLKGPLLHRASICASGALSAVAMWAYLIFLYTEIFSAAVVCALIFTISLLLSSYLYLTEAL